MNMASEPHNLDRIRIQTARMLEIYSLVAGELQSRGGVDVRPEDHARLRGAIETIAGNMAELQANLASEQEDASTARAKEDAAQTQANADAVAGLSGPISLDDLVNAVLRWSVDSKAGE